MAMLVFVFLMLMPMRGTEFTHATLLPMSHAVQLDRPLLVSQSSLSSLPTASGLLGASTADAATTTTTTPTTFFEREHAAWCAKHDLHSWRAPWRRPGSSGPRSTATVDRVAVWMAGRGDYFQAPATAFLLREFPAATVLWSRRAHVHCHPDTLSMTMASSLTMDQAWDGPRHMPVFVWNGEGSLTIPVHDLAFPPALHLDTRMHDAAVDGPWWSPATSPGSVGSRGQDADAKAETETAAFNSVHRHFVPYILATGLPEDTPHSLRSVDDDIASRTFSVCYINSHCTMVRACVFTRCLLAVYVCPVHV